MKCFGCHEYVDYVSNCSKRQETKKQVVASASVEELSSRMEDEFALIVCMVSSTSQNIWYIDNGASFHMIGVREYLDPVIRRRKPICIFILETYPNST